MSRYLAWLLMLCAPLNFIRASTSPSWEELSAKQQAQLSSGKAVVIEEDVPGEPWPILTIYQIANCSPEEIAGVFGIVNSTPSISRAAAQSVSLNARLLRFKWRNSR